MVRQTMNAFVVIVGATASGKSELAMHLASVFACEIVVCDSVQIYRGFNIGSTKPSPDLRQQIKHHLVDRLNWHEDYDAGRYSKEARQTITEIKQRGKLPLVVAGCGLYLRALLGTSWHTSLPRDEALRQKLKKFSNTALQKQLLTLDPQRAAQINLADRVRLMRALEIATLTGKPLAELTPDPAFALQPFIVYIKPKRAQLCEKIAARVERLLAQGIVEEVRKLLDEGCPANCKPMQSIGYKQTCAFLQGHLPKAELAMRMTIATRQYAKRQTTWFNRLASNVRIEEVDALSKKKLTQEIEKLLQK